MKRIVFAAILAVVLLGSGCMQTSTLEWKAAAPGQKSSSGADVVWNLRGYNSGLYLFYYIPLWSGRPRRPNRRDYKFFEHNVTCWDMRRLLDSHLDDLDADRVEDVVCTEDNSGITGLWIFWRRSMIARGVAVKGGAKK